MCVAFKSIFTHSRFHGVFVFLPARHPEPIPWEFEINRCLQKMQALWNFYFFKQEYFSSFFLIVSRSYSFCPVVLPSFTLRLSGVCPTFQRWTKTSFLRSTHLHQGDSGCQRNPNGRWLGCPTERGAWAAQRGAEGPTDGPEAGPPPPPPSRASALFLLPRLRLNKRGRDLCTTQLPINFASNIVRTKWADDKEAYFRDFRS